MFDMPYSRFLHERTAKLFLPAETLYDAEREPAAAISRRKGVAAPPVC